MRVIGHRGAAALAPENTWAGFEAALRIGVDAIETDVRATGDGVLVLFHDARLDRTTDGRGYVYETPWSVVRSLDAGSWFDDAFRGVRVPRLRETLARYGRRTHVVLEIKQAGLGPDVLDVVRDLGLMGRVTFTTFDFARARRIKTQAPGANVGFLTSDLSSHNVRRVIAAHLDQVCPPAACVTRENVAESQAQGLDVRAWGVQNRELMLRAIQAEVDGMTVDFPHLLLEALGRRRQGGGSL